jgi:hypothetical protein
MSDEDGKLWARRDVEFEDGRFHEITPRPTARSSASPAPAFRSRAAKCRALIACEQNGVARLINA